MRNLPKSIAFDIYARKYWDALELSQIERASPAITIELADSSVNCGQTRTAEWLQRCLNSFNQQGELYPDLVVDGDIGPATLAALGSYLNKRGYLCETVLLRALNSLQGACYIGLTERRQKDETFSYGWFANRVD